MKTAVYVRVSTDKQDVTRQNEDISNYCNYKGYKIDRTFEETMSGTIKNRPVLKEMMEYISTNQIKVLLISELSRLGRTNEITNIIEELTENGVNLITLKEGISTLDEDGKPNHIAGLLTDILAGINKFELKTMKYRIESGLRASALNGNVNGGPFLPYGYKRGDDKKYHIDENESYMIKYIYKLYLEGNGTQKIKNRLNAEGYQTRKGVKWSEQTVYRILNNNIYRGKREYKGELIDLPELQIIPTDTFNGVQRRLRSHYNKIGINVKHNLKIERRKIICGICGKTYYAHKRSNGKDNAYKCISRRYGENCGNVAVNIDKLTNSIDKVILNWFPEELLRGIDTSEIDSDINTLLDELNTARGELKMLQKEELTIVDMKLNDRLSDRQFDVKNKQIQDGLVGTQDDIERLEEELVDLKKLRSNSNNLQVLARDIRRNGISKELLKKIVKNITIKPYPKQISTVKNDVTILVELTLTTLSKYSFLITRYSDILKEDPAYLSIYRGSIK